MATPWVCPCSGNYSVKYRTQLYLYILGSWAGRLPVWLWGKLICRTVVATTSHGFHAGDSCLRQPNAITSCIPRLGYSA